MPRRASGTRNSGSKTMRVRIGLSSLLWRGIPNLSECPFRAYAITCNVIFRTNLVQNYKKIRIYAKKMQKNLHISKKSSTFASAFERNAPGAIAQLVEQRTENPCVPSSILGGTTKKRLDGLFFFTLPPNKVEIIRGDRIRSRGSLWVSGSCRRHRLSGRCHSG